MRIPRESDFEWVFFFKIKLSRDCGNIESWRVQTKPCAHQDPGERTSDLTLGGARLAVCVWESAAEVRVDGGLSCDQRH